MAQDKLLCPVESCRQVLKLFVCPSHGDIRDLFYKNDISDEEITDILCNNLNGYLDLDCSTLVLPGSGGQRPFTLPTHETRVDRVEELARRLRTLNGASPTRLTAAKLGEYIYRVHRGLTSVPQVTAAGDKPMLFRLKEKETGRDELYWPFQEPSDQMVIHGGLGYTGPKFTPKRTGAFEEFLASVRCRDEDSRAVLRAWLMGAVLQQIIGAGDSPLLLICASGHSVGKSTTADTVAAILGGGLTTAWTHDIKADDIARQLLDPRARCMCVDNIVPPPNSRIFNNHVLCSLITRPDIQTKLLFGRGFVSVINLVAFIGTANVPSLASDMLARSAICELSDKGANKSVDWRSKWVARRVEILADIMALAIENWKKGPYPVEGRFRFTNWQHHVARALQAEPVTIPKHTIVRSPLEHCLDEVFLGAGGVERVRLDEAAQFINSAHVGWCGTTRLIQTVEAESIQNDLQYYNALYRVQKQEDALWVVREKR